DARRRQHSFTLDLDDACPAIAVRPIARRILPAQMRDRGAEPLRRLPDGLVRAGFDLPAVEREDDLVRHQATSPWKWLITDRIGLGPAWPSPPIDASAMACANSPSSGWSHTSLLISLTAFSQPTRHGVHWPQDSSSKKRRRFTATSRMLSWSDRITTAWLP